MRTRDLYFFGQHVEVRETTINDRWRLWLPKHRAERAEWVTGWERERLDAMHAVIVDLVEEYEGSGEDGPIVVDVGAEEGDLTALYASWGATIVAVEPNPRVWPNIRVCFAANNLRPPIDMFPGFAGAAVQHADPNCEAYDPAQLRADWDGWPRCSTGPVIGNHGFRHLAEEQDATPTITLDVLCLTCDVITLDVEGAELEALKGAHRLLEMSRPHVFVSVHPEFMAHWFGQTRDDLFAYMTERRYAVRWLATDHEEHWHFFPKELA